MPTKEFLTHCTACGGNWTAMLASGIKALWPEEYAALPEHFSFWNVSEILERKLTDF